MISDNKVIWNFLSIEKMFLMMSDHFKGVLRIFYMGVDSCPMNELLYPSQNPV